MLIGHASANQALREDPACPSRSPGRRGTYTRLPYFFSDQYDLGMDYVDYRGPGDAVVVRGNLADREFIAFWHRDGIVTAAMSVNVWEVVEDLRAMSLASARSTPLVSLTPPFRSANSPDIAADPYVNSRAVSPSSDTKGWCAIGHARCVAEAADHSPRRADAGSTEIGGSRVHPSVRS